MDYKSLLHMYMKQRHLELWNQVTKLYEIEDSLNAKVHTWIMEGTVSEKSRQVSKPVFQPDDRPIVPQRS